MKIKLTARTLTSGIALAALVVFAGSAMAASYTKTVNPIGNGFGITDLVWAMPNTNTSSTSLTRGMDNVTLSEAFSNNGLTQINGAFLDYGYKYAGSKYLEDIVGFTVSVNPNHPDTLNVWSNLAAICDGNLASLSELGLGGVTAGASGVVGFEANNYYNEINSIDAYGVGTLSIAAPGITLGTWATGSYIPYAGPDSLYFTPMGYGTGTANVWSVPGVDEKTGVLFSSNYDDVLGAFASNFTANYTNTFGSAKLDLTPNGLQLANAPTNGPDDPAADGSTRGSLSANGYAKTAAVFVRTEEEEDNAIADEIKELQYFTYSVSGNNVNVLTNNAYSFNQIDGDSTDWFFGTGFYSSTSYQGPTQISINDNGDIVFPVVILPAGRPDNTLPPASGYRKIYHVGILFMSHSNPGHFKLVADNASLYPMMEHFTSGTQYPGIGGAVIDNQDNVYFTAVNFDSGTSSSEPRVILRASANDPSTPTSWITRPVAWEGLMWKDASGNTDELDYLPELQTGTSDYLAAITSLNAAGGMSRKGLTQNAGSLFNTGALAFSAGVYIGTAKEQDGVVYVAPTQGTPASTNVAQALTQAVGSPATLFNCTIAGSGTPFTTTTGSTSALKTWFHWYITDQSGSQIQFSTLRNDLYVGELIDISGKIATGSPVVLSPDSYEGIVALGTPQASLKLKVVLSNYQGDVTKVPVIVYINNAPFTAFPDASGNISIPVVESVLNSANYTVAVKATHWLSQQATAVAATGSPAVANLGTVTLLNGDVNGDDFVEDQDYSSMGAAWYTQQGVDANYDARADLNGDGFVEDQDYSILGLNWYTGGYFSTL
jgi:hypothetical protein